MTTTLVLKIRSHSGSKELAMRSKAISTLLVGIGVAHGAYAQGVPNLPPPNPFLATSAFPISHSNPGATEAVPHAGPTKGRQLSVADVKTCRTSSPLIRGSRTWVASGLSSHRASMAYARSWRPERPSTSSRSYPIPATRIIRTRRRPPPFRPRWRRPMRPTGARTRHDPGDVRADGGDRLQPSANRGRHL